MSVWKHSCKKQKQACQREIDDRKRSENDDFPYYFDLKEANKSIKFISLIPKTEFELLFDTVIITSDSRNRQNCKI